MKNYILYTALLIVAGLFSACDENEIMPAYTKKGTATQTVATLTVSKAKPAPSEVVTLTLKFVNPASDPIKQVVLKAKVGTADYVEVTTFDTQSATQNSEITYEVNYNAPAASKTKVVFDMVISSAKEYPQIKRTEMTVQ